MINKWLQILEVATKEIGLSLNVEEGIKKGEGLLQTFNDEATDRGVYRLPRYMLSITLYKKSLYGTNIIWY